eukprot:Sspe_Gene.17994::Locus_6439_Transcript_2_5_Confidence_0.455_Length_458::g.17994::m.17994
MGENGGKGYLVPCEFECEFLGLFRHRVPSSPSPCHTRAFPHHIAVPVMSSEKVRNIACAVVLALLAVVAVLLSVAIAPDSDLKSIVPLPSPPPPPPSPALCLPLFHSERGG